MKAALAVVCPVPPYPIPIVPKSPDPSKVVPLTVLIFVPLTNAVCLPLKVFQSVELK